MAQSSTCENMNLWLHICGGILRHLVLIMESSPVLACSRTLLTYWCNFQLPVIAAQWQYSPVLVQSGQRNTFLDICGANPVWNTFKKVRGGGGPAWGHACPGRIEEVKLDWWEQSEVLDSVEVNFVWVIYKKTFLIFLIPFMWNTFLTLARSWALCI